MITFPSSASEKGTSTSVIERIKTAAMHLATATAAVIGLSAMAAGAASAPVTFEDGVYLFGESSVTDTLGAVYFVFQVENQTLTGAVYQPLSSFDCVRGTVEDNRLALTVIDAFEQTQHPYSVAIVPGEATVADTQGIAQEPQIEGMYRIHELSELEEHMLTTCAF